MNTESVDNVRKGDAFLAIAALLSAYIILRSAMVFWSDPLSQMRPGDYMKISAPLAAKLPPKQPETQAIYPSMYEGMAQPDVRLTFAAREQQLLLKAGTNDMQSMKFSPLLKRQQAAHWSNYASAEEAGNRPLAKPSNFPAVFDYMPPEQNRYSPVLGAEPLQEKKSRRFSGYGYVYMRGGGGLAGSPSYGGSQLFGSLYYRLAPSSAGNMASRTQFYVSVSRDLGDEQADEAAMGLRIQPLATVPVTIHAEQRLRADRPDAMALYASAGGTYAMGGNRTLSAYGQAGAITGSGGGDTHFYDAQLRLESLVLRDSPVQISAGTGAYAAGDKYASRIDIGPIIGINMKAADADLHFEASWRSRIAGDAKPNSGPALLLSASF